MCFSTLVRVVILIGLFAGATGARAQEFALGGSVDLHLPVTENADANRLQPRGAELRLAGALDEYFDGLLNVVAHTEDGATEFEVHEAQLIWARGIPGWRARAGKFLLNVGFLNRTHRHEWPFIVPPAYHTRFFSEEGASDSGIELSRMAEAPGMATHLGITESYTYGHAHDAGERPPRPLVTLRQTFFLGEEGSREWDWGLNALDRVGADREQTTLAGLDLIYRQIESKELVFLVLGELWHREVSAPGAEARRDLGFYLLYERALTPRWSLGLRLDGYVAQNTQDALTGETLRDVDYGFSPIITWSPSDVTTLRFSGGYEVDTLEGTPERHERRADLQLVFAFGAHGHSH